ncbi:uncharacterized protein LOC133921220 isoform X2 [Phragmites australis]|uniref:uncharacterized protein LOC133921220 isoform X2 n=1 Tax=Phragmites australis TaxID=29695 RepID=UPI002D7848C6|nr:uncharacterized protein LOC133921220 isoform X2 [Phragmites australis]
MVRGVDSDYIDLSLMGAFDMGINFDGFEENVKKFMELPINYLNSAHDKAVDLIEDVHAMICATFPDDVVPSKPHEIFKDPSSSNVITGSSPTSVETELIGPNAEVSTPASLITVENSCTGCVDTGADETESFLTKSPENTTSKGGHIEANDLCLLPEDTSTTELYDSCNSEEVILWNPEISVKPPRPPDKMTEQVGLHCSGHSDILVESSVFYGAIPLENSGANYEEQMVLHNLNDPVEATAHETISHDLSADVSRCADDPNMCPDDMIKFVNIDLRDDQEHMKNDKFEASSVHLRKNTSFKKMFMRNLSGKIRWSKKQSNAHQVVSARSQDEENLGYQAVSSSDDLEDDWEVVM